MGSPASFIPPRLFYCIGQQKYSYCTLFFINILLSVENLHSGDLVNNERGLRKKTAVWIWCLLAFSCAIRLPIKKWIKKLGDLFSCREGGGRVSKAQTPTYLTKKCGSVVSSPRCLPSPLEQLVPCRKWVDCYFKLNNVTWLHQDKAALSNSRNLQR